MESDCLMERNHSHKSHKNISHHNLLFKSKRIETIRVEH